MATIGTRIREARKAKGWTLTRLAQEAGVSKSYLSQIEANHKGNPSIRVAGRIATALGVSVIHLLEGVPLSRDRLSTEDAFDVLAALLFPLDAPIEEARFFVFCDVFARAVDPLQSEPTEERFRGLYDRWDQHDTLGSPLYPQEGQMYVGVWSDSLTVLQFQGGRWKTLHEQAIPEAPPITVTPCPITPEDIAETRVRFHVGAADLGGRCTDADPRPPEEP